MVWSMKTAKSEKRHAVCNGGLRPQLGRVYPAVCGAKVIAHYRGELQEWNPGHLANCDHCKRRLL